jgi:hypothetical protein
MAKDIKTTTEIAKELGLSRYVVSSVLNGKEKERRVAPATVKRVRDFVNSANFYQNISALSMRGKYSKDVAIILHPMLFLDQRRIYFRLLEYLNDNALSHSSLFFYPQKMGIFYSEFDHFNPKKVIVFSYFLECDENFAAWKVFCEKLMKGRNCFYHDFPVADKKRLSFIKGSSATGMNRGEMKRMGIEKLLREKYEYIFIPESHSELKIVKRNNQVKFIPYTLETETLSYKNNFYEDALLERGRRLGEFIVASNIVPGKTAAMIYNEYTAAGAVDVFAANSIKVPDDIEIITKGGMSEANYFRMNVESWIYPCQGMYQAIIDWIEDKYESGKITEFSNFLKTTNKKRR